MKPTDKGPFEGPYVIATPKPSIEAVLAKFEGERTKKTFAAAKRQQRPGILRVPRNLMNQVWLLTGGWEEFSRTFPNRDYRRDDFPVPDLKRHWSSRYAGRDENPIPWRDRASIRKIGGLELLFLPEFDGPELLLRWRGWIFGAISPKYSVQEKDTFSGHMRSVSKDNWRDLPRVRDVVATMCRPLIAGEADAWGFATLAEIQAEIAKRKERR